MLNEIKFKFIIYAHKLYNIYGKIKTNLLIFLIFKVKK